ncbi:MAG: VCBS repeat-containing protein [Acidobacteriota bacterium]|nr:VCBS repeat-containing protein [Acidobacteriota bacterium]
MPSDTIPSANEICRSVVAGLAALAFLGGTPGCAQETPPTSTAPVVRQEVQTVTPNDLNIDLRQLMLLAPVHLWKPGDPIKVIDDLHESGASEPAPNAPPAGAPPAAPSGAVPQNSIMQQTPPLPVNPAVTTQDVREMPRSPTWKPGEPVQVVPDLRQTPPAETMTAAPAGPLVKALTAASPLTPPVPAIGANFDGIGATGFLPPDTVGDVGPNHYVQMVNSSLAIYNKTGTLLAGPVAINSFWTGFGGPCQSLNNGDPIVRYDALANRWLISQFALPASGAKYQCMAVSKTPDPVAGGWYLYAFPVGPFPDYPKIGVWLDGYYMSSQQGYPSGPVDAWAFERSKMLAGQPAQQVHFTVTGTSLILLPSDLDGQPPPAGTPNYFVRQVDGARYGGSDRLDLFAFSVNWSNTLLSTFTPLPSLATTPFDSILCSNDLMSLCVPQPGTAVKLETLTAWTMWRAQYRNFGGRQTLMVSHTVDANGADLAGVRWYELRRTTGGSWSIYQQGTHSPDATNRWMGSAAMDAAGDIAVGFSVSSSSVFPGIRAAVRRPIDTPGTLPQEVTLQAGGGSQTYASAPRWGNYSTMDVDPVNDCTFWYTAQYYSSTSAAGWKTRITALTDPNCTAPNGSWVISNLPIANFASWAATAGAVPLVGDFNGDGRDDIALIGPSGWATIPIAFSNGDGSFNVTNMPIANFASWAATPGAKPLVGDFNGDGKSDIALTGPTGWATLPVAFSNGNGSFTVTNVAIANFASWATTAGAKPLAGDFNGDGRTDIALTGPSGWATLPVAFSNGNGSFNVTNQPIAGFATWAATANAKPLVGDFNGDGKTDVALTGSSGWGTLPVAFSNGNGSFTVTNLSITNFGTWAATSDARPLVGDFNGDGKTDVALTGPSGWATLPVAFSNGNGSFNVTNQAITNFAAWAATFNAVPLVGDFNGDGRTDVALTGPFGWGSIPVAFSNGNGTFTVTNQSVSGFATWAATAGAKPLVGAFGGTGRKDIALTGPNGWATLPVAFSISH